MKQRDEQIHHRRSIRLKGYDYSQAGGYFVTICTWQRECLFGEVVAGEMRLSTVGKIVQWEWRHLGEGFGDVRLGAFVVMPNHVHGIIIIDGRGRATRPGENIVMEGDGDSDGPGRATRSGENIVMEGDGQLPDEAMIEMGGSPVRGAGGDVGATQQGLKGVPSGEEQRIYRAMVGNGGSPWRGQDGAMEGECNARDGDSDGRGRATRPGKMNDMEGEGRLQEDVVAEIGGSPVHRAEGPPPKSLGAMIGQWKSRVTKRAWKLPGMQGRPIWLRNYYEHIIRDEADMLRIEEYIQNNPRRWEQDQLHPQASPNKFNQDR